MLDRFALQQAKVGAMSSEYSFCSEGGFDELSSSSDSGFDVSFESPKHEVSTDTLFPPAKEEKRKKTRNTRCKSPTQVNIHKFIIINYNLFSSKHIFPKIFLRDIKILMSESNVFLKNWNNQDFQFLSILFLRNLHLIIYFSKVFILFIYFLS